VSGTIFLARHGRTALNAEGRSRERCDVPLDDRGFVQAADAVHQFVSTGVKDVHTSPLLRTVQMAELIAHACGARIIGTDDLMGTAT